MLDISQIPAPRVPLVESETRVTTREWYRFFYNIWSVLYGGLSQGYFFDTTVQTTPATDTAIQITFNNVGFNKTIYRDPTLTSRIYVPQAVTCNIQFTAQVDSLSASVGSIYFWLRVNGANVTNTGSLTNIQDTNAGQSITRTFVYSFAAGDYFQIMWATRTHNDLRLVPSSAVAPVTSIPSASLIVTSLIGV